MSEAQLRAELEEARARLRVLQTVFEHAPATILHVTRDGTIMYVNRSLLSDPETVRGTTIYQWADPADHDEIRAVMARVFQTGDQGEYLTSAVGTSSERRQFLTRVAPVIRDGVVESVILISTDITKLKETESELKQSQQTLQHVLDATGTGTWWWDVDRGVGARDEQVARLFDIDVTDANMDTLESFVHPEDRARVRQDFDRAVARRGRAVLVHRLVRRDGSIRWVHASAQLVDGPFGRRMLGGVRDITERKMLEARLAVSNKLESVGRLAGGVAHDFNNMLTVISSNLDRVLRKLPESSPFRSDLGAARIAADRSAALTSQLLAFARRQMAIPDLVQIDELLRQQQGFVQRTLGAVNVLELQLGASSQVRIDPKQLEHILGNLASNAHDAMPQGGRVTIATSDVTLDDTQAMEYPGARPGPFVKLRFADTGVGIRQGDLEHVFEPFFTTKQHGEGTGLGLATCYGIISQNDGFITVSSSPRGTTFEILLPASPPA